MTKAAASVGSGKEMMVPNNPVPNPPAGFYRSGNRHKPAFQRHADATISEGRSDRRASKRKNASQILIDAARDFGNIRRPSLEQIVQFKELFYQLIDRLPTNDRRNISAMLARLTFTPRPVALYFAQDLPEIAAPFLLFSTVLGDIDLRAIATKKGRSHARIIQKREIAMDSLTRSTLDAILSDTSGEKPDTPENQDDNVNAEPDITTASSQEWLGGEEIIALAAAGGRLGKGKSRSSRPAPKKARSAAQLTLPKPETRRLLSYARTQDDVGVANYIETLCGLDSSACLRLIHSDSGLELVYLIKALGLTAPHDMQLLLMIMPRIGRRIEAYREVKQLLDELDGGICRMIFNEIGARFEMAGGPSSTINATDENQASYLQSARRRRESLEPGRGAVPAAQAEADHFDFSTSFMATG